MDPVALTVVARRTIEAEALRAYPEEGCGFLIGRGDRVVGALPRPNVHPGPRATRYRIDGLEWVRLEDEIEGRGDRLVGVFHSHPSHPAIPSETDRSTAWPGLLYLIQAVDAPGSLGDLRAWRLDDGSTFRPLRLDDA